MPDYAALAKQFGGTPDADPSAAPSKRDYAALARQFGGGAADLPTRPVSAEDFLTPQSSKGWPAKLMDVGRGLFNTTIGALPELATAASDAASTLAGNPLAAMRTFERAKGAREAQLQQFDKAGREFAEGRTSEALGHVGAGALPLAGPAAAQAGEKIGAGNAEGVGEAIGMLAPFGAPAALARLPGLRVPGVGLAREAGVAEAIAAGQKAGIPIDAATATGNSFVKAAQKIADESLGGSVISGKAKAAQKAAVEAQAKRLAEQAHPTPVTPMEAGEAAQRGVRDVVGAQREAANTAYDRLRAIEADPANAVEIAPDIAPPNPDAPWSFTMKSAPTVDEVFGEALKDARINGFKGTAAELREAFNKRTEQARGLKAATAEGDEYSHAALLKEIRSRGGIRPSDPDFIQGAPTRAMKGEYTASQQATKKNYGKNAVYRNDGIALDDMLQQLSEDPKWGAVITENTDLVDVIHKGGLESPKMSGNIEHHLRGVGVQPGAQWWREGEAAKVVPMAVDLTETKAAMQPIYDALKAEADVVPFMSGSGKGKAFVALDRLMKSPDAAPLSIADAALSELKSMARSADPNLRTAGQGIAARAVNNLHRAVGEAAERAGPQAVQALEEGRVATKAKYAAAKVLQGLEGRQGTKSGATAARGLTSAGDISVPRLRATLEQTPQAKPLIARSVLDGILDSPTAGPDATFKAWQKIGPETKELLFDATHAKAIDDFLLLRKKIAENPNPSGSGMIALKGGEIAALASGHPIYTLTAPMVSALLHSPTGVRVLTQGFRIPMVSPVARAAHVAALSRALKSAGQPAPILAPQAPPMVPAFAGNREQER